MPYGGGGRAGGGGPPKTQMAGGIVIILVRHLVVLPKYLVSFYNQHIGPRGPPCDLTFVFPHFHIYIYMLSSRFGFVFRSLNYSLLSCLVLMLVTIVSGRLVCGPRPNQYQFRGFKSNRVHERNGLAESAGA